MYNYFSHFSFTKRITGNCMDFKSFGDVFLLCFTLFYVNVITRHAVTCIRHMCTQMNQNA